VKANLTTINSESITNFKFGNIKVQEDKDTPNTAGSEGVAGSTKSQTVKFSLTRTVRFEIASSSIISTGPLSVENSENTGDRRTLLKDVVTDLALST
jgi:hypothetical protein